ncbi:MAG: tripartite tricarboxylate transporter substrate binding protein [Actinobacteria bacterium]|uniref:Unannotated protein n=1 Tax=freshwater metagenome TaxID=449393 RepID=A0A6J7NBN0_9ZZZZ|nr:tripartite tricarboxylate transporter substrate binding protein [Actinomycetota bacterium]
MGSVLRLPLIILSGLAISSIAAAQDYPVRPIRIVVPFVAGGGTDLLARTLAQKFNETWGQPAIVDNRPGGTGAVGSVLVAQSAPDGYTMLLATSSTHAISPNFFRKPPYHPVTEFAAVSLTAVAPEIVVAHPSVPASSIKELVALAKTKPAALNYASPGTGTIGNMTGELFKIVTGTAITHIPYKGSGAAMRDLLGGQVQLMFSGPSGMLQHIRAGKLKALGVAARLRMPELKDVPTLAESGYPTIEASNWYAVLTSAGTPVAVIQKINAEIVRAMQLPEIKEMLMRQGYEAKSSTPAELAALIKEDLAKWNKVVKSSGMQVD